MRKLCLLTLFLTMVAIGAVGLAIKLGCPMRGLTVTYSNTVESLPDVVERVIGDVVHIRNNSGQWQGSGVLIMPDLVLTARHIVERGEDFTVTTNDGREFNVNRAISSKKYDLGFIKLEFIDELPNCGTIIGDIRECRLGQKVFAVGSPYGDMNFNSVTAGIISSLHRDLENFGLSKSYGWSISFQTDAAGHPGNSGCPVYTMDGKVRGILVGRYSNALIYCIPAELIRDDCQVIQLMFLIDEYRKEVEPSIPLSTYYWEYDAFTAW
jgi:S1-C subfamily serine protease